MKKKIPQRGLLTIVFIVSMTSILSLSACKKHAAAEKENTRTDATGQVSVDATAGFGNGVNLQPSYYNGGNPNFGWSLMKQQTKIKTVRIEIEPGYVTQAKSWISQARSNGYAVIATYHKASVLGSDNTSELNAAANWWVSNYSNLASAGSFTINLMNEWGSHNLSANAYASAYNTAISTVRRVYSGAIIIDASGWGQETAIAAAAAKGTNGTKINDGNYILSAHIYPGSWNQAKGRYVNKSDIDDMASSGRPCMIGEFGNSGGSGADWSGIVDYARGKGWTVLAWAWNGDGGSMNMVTPSWASNGGATSFSLSSYFNTAYSKL
jgi:hypothetical protein